MADELHTPTPWKLDGGKGKHFDERYVWSDRDEKGKGYLGTHEVCVAVVKGRRNNEGQDCTREEIIEADARRIVACVNALAGVPTDDLERIARRFPTDPGARLRYLADALAGLDVDA